MKGKSNLISRDYKVAIKNFKNLDSNVKKNLLFYKLAKKINKLIFNSLLIKAQKFCVLLELVNI